MYSWHKFYLVYSRSLQQIYILDKIFFWQVTLPETYYTVSFSIVNIFKQYQKKHYLQFCPVF